MQGPRCLHRRRRGALRREARRAGLQITKQAERCTALASPQGSIAHRRASQEASCADRYTEQPAPAEKSCTALTSPQGSTGLRKQSDLGGGAVQIDRPSSMMQTDAGCAVGHFVCWVCGPSRNRGTAKHRSMHQSSRAMFIRTVDCRDLPRWACRVRNAAGLCTNQPATTSDHDEHTHNRGSIGFHVFLQKWGQCGRQLP